MNFQLHTTLDAGLGRHVRHAFESLEELGTAIGIAGIIEGIHADEDIGGIEHFGPREREGKKNRVARGDVGNRNLARHFVRGTPLGDFHVTGKRGTAEHAQVELRRAMSGYADRFRHSPGGLEFDAMPLAVIERERVELEALAPGEREASGRIEPAAEQTDGFQLFQALL